MKKIQWNPDKSQQILNNPNRGVSLAHIADLINSGNVLAIEQRPHYQDQRAFVVSIEAEVWCVPFREDEHTIFLITAWPDRKLKKRYQE